MNEKLRNRIANRYRVGFASQNTPRHPEAKPHGRYFNEIKQQALKPGRVMSSYRPRTKAEVRMAYRGLFNFMDFFSGDRKLAARACGVSLSTINSMIKKGYVTPFVALCAQRIPEMPWLPAGLAPYLQYEEDWDEAREKFDSWIAKAEVNRKTMKKVLKTRRKPTHAGTICDEDKPPPLWAEGNKEDIIG